jgi:hypothetical protein
MSGKTLNMSKVDKLLQNIFEYKDLLSFLDKNHPTALEDWKNFKIEEKYRHWATDPATRSRDITNPGGGICYLTFAFRNNKHSLLRIPTDTNVFIAIKPYCIHMDTCGLVLGRRES